MLLTIESLICKQKCMSTVWGYFGFIPRSDNNNQHKDPNEVICKICFKEMGSLPKLPIYSNTLNLLSHLYTYYASYRNPFVIESRHG